MDQQLLQLAHKYPRLFYFDKIPIGKWGSIYMGTMHKLLTG
jgi:hypothetical protein